VNKLHFVHFSSCKPRQNAALKISDKGVIDDASVMIIIQANQQELLPMRLAIASLIAASALVSTAALAEFSNIVTAKLEAPAASAQVIAAGAAWACAGDTCVARMERRTPIVRDCRQLVREVGRVKEFRVGTVSMSEADVAKCNEAAR
jgi:hypothetical protein